MYEAGSFVPLARFVAAPVEGIETPQRRQGRPFRKLPKSAAQLTIFGLTAYGVQTVGNESNILVFRAAVTAIYTEGGVLTVAFADSTSAESENYLILQQEAPRAKTNESDDYYFEINDRSISGEGGFQRAYSDGDDLVILFAEELSRKHSCQGISVIGVKSTCDVAELLTALHDVFDKTRYHFDA
ncbi:hypothetical protein [Paraburkholderia sp. 22B1P]|uniref:hypothetical protein n=1 Tax=Paraburkholderia sp. 22B1P TaxID=3080498 RepID=UPI0030867ADD|nr:Imm10 family immunity protein [Paraburkholderia sp. 22B1P]